MPENRKAGLLQDHLLLLHASISHHQQRSADSASRWLLLVVPREAILSAVRHQFVEPTCGAHKVQKIQRIQKNLLELLKIYYNTGFILRNCRIGRWEQCGAIKWSRLHTGLQQKYVLDLHAKKWNAEERWDSFAQGRSTDFSVLWASSWASVRTDVVLSGPWKLLKINEQMEVFMTDSETDAKWLVSNFSRWSQWKN